MSLQDGLTACLALVFIVALILCLRPVLRGIERARGGARNPAGLVLIGQIGIDRTRRLSVVRYGAREVFLLTGGANDVLLDGGRESGFERGFEAELESRT